IRVFISNRPVLWSKVCLFNFVSFVVKNDNVTLIDRAVSGVTYRFTLVPGILIDVPRRHLAITLDPGFFHQPLLIVITISVFGGIPRIPLLLHCAWRRHNNDRWRIVFAFYALVVGD